MFKRSSLKQQRSCVRRYEKKEPRYRIRPNKTEEKEKEEKKEDLSLPPVEEIPKAQPRRYSRRKSNKQR